MPACSARASLQRPVPEPKSNEVLVKVHYTAINRADTLQRKGQYAPPPGATDILGLEMVGEVTAHGAGCSAATASAYPIGARVMALLSGGGNAEYAAVHEQHLLPIPSGMSWETAAAVPETWLTAYQLLFLVGGLKRASAAATAAADASGGREKVLIHAAGSGVGTAAVQLASRAGAEVVAVAGHDSKLEAVRALGAAHTCNYKTADFAACVKAAVGGVDLILDPVGGSFAKQNADALAMDGRWVLYGSMGGLATDAQLLPPILRKRVSLMGTTLRNRSDAYKADLVSRFAADILPGLADGSYAPVVDSVMPLEDVQGAHDHMESNATTGKILLRVI